MKKNTMMAILSYLNGENIENLDEIKTEIETELRRNKDKADANRAAYESAHDIIIEALSNQPVTVAELYAEIEGLLPAGFTKGKVQYALGHFWEDEIVKIEGKPNTYRLAL